jgi:DNA recombination-dependent growth factor C
MIFECETSRLVIDWRNRYSFVTKVSSNLKRIIAADNNHNFDEDNLTMIWVYVHYEINYEG